jgi:hypothetical protein
MNDNSESNSINSRYNIPGVKKQIKKYYEPLIDGKMVFRYEDDPEEYKKARKRLQNRESATRVRARKKDRVEN